MACPEDNKCTFCGKHGETQGHILEECKGIDICRMKTEMYDKLAVIILDTKIGENKKLSRRKREEIDYLREWTPTAIQKLWKGEIGTLHTSDTKLHSTK